MWLRKSIFSLALFIVAGNLYARQPEKWEQVRIDSIFAAIDKMPADTQTVNYIISIQRDFLWEFDLPESYNKLKYALKISLAKDYDEGAYRSYNAMSAFCIRTGANEFALTGRQKALEIAIRQKDSIHIVNCYVGLGLVYGSMLNDSLAMVYYQKALPITESTKDKDKISRLYAFMGWCYQALGKDSLALFYADRALTLRREMKYSLGVQASLGSVRSIYFWMGNYAKAREAADEQFVEASSQHDTLAIAEVYLYYCKDELRQRKNDSALWFVNKAFSYGLKKDDRATIRESYRLLAQVYDSIGDHDKSYNFFKLYVHIKDSLSEAERVTQTLRTKEIYDLESKNAEIDLLNQETLVKEKDLESQRKSLWGLGIILSFTALLAILVFRGYRQKKRSADEIGMQKKIVEEKNADITNSIIYAKRIQQALLPSIQSIKQVFPDSFVFYQPKDIVSGDFFWFNETKNNYFLAVVDCTGHGVPGALMSAIGYNFFGQIVNEMKIENCAEILNELHRKVLMALNKDLSTREIKDGMDVCLVRIPKDNSAIEFCGAVRPVYVIENGKTEIVKGDIFSIGGVKDANTESFTSHRIERKTGRTLYLFSDGFADQFGGPRGKKLKYKGFQELLLKNVQLNMEQQQEELDKAFNEWKGKLEQVDDVCVIGVRL